MNNKDKERYEHHKRLFMAVQYFPFVIQNQKFIN